MAPVPASLKRVYTVSGAFTVVAVFYAWVGLEPAPLIETGIRFGPLISVVTWSQRDAALRRYPLVFDWGFFVLSGWQVAVPWYVRHIGLGWSVVARLFGAILAPDAARGVVTFLRTTASGAA
jgi:hypothetical protein